MQKNRWQQESCQEENRPGRAAGARMSPEILDNCPESRREFCVCQVVTGQQVVLVQGSVRLWRTLSGWFHAESDTGTASILKGTPNNGTTWMLPHQGKAGCGKGWLCYPLQRLARRVTAIPPPNQRSPHQNRSPAHHDQG